MDYEGDPTEEEVNKIMAESCEEDEYNDEEEILSPYEESEDSQE